MPNQIHITHWDGHHEVDQSRKVRGPLNWVAIPTRQGLGYCRLVAEHGAKGLGVWLALVELAASRQAEDRGTIDGTVDDAAMMARLPTDDVRSVVGTLSDLGWITLETSSNGPSRSVVGAQSDDAPTVVVPTRQDRTLQERTEQDKTNKRASTLPPVAASLAVFLRDAILTHLPSLKTTPAKLAGWARDLDLAMRLDDRTEENIRAVIDYAHREAAGEFWRPNILSGKKLREKFDVLEAQRLRRVNQPALELQEAIRRENAEADELNRRGREQMAGYEQ